MHMLIWIIIVLLLICLLFTLVAYFVLYNATGFNKRCDGNKNLKYMEAKDFKNLNAIPINFKSDKRQNLRGFIYKSSLVSSYKGFIIFSHGIGGGHLSYTTEINYFAQKGYIVMGYDNTGTCSSDGKKLNGLTQGIIDLKYAIKYSQTIDDLKNLPLFLIGHSWGGYSVCNVMKIFPNAPVKGILAFSPFNSINTLISDLSNQKIKIKTGFLNFFFDIVNSLKFGKAGLLKSCDTIASNQIPVLVMHGEDDPVVSFKNSPVGLKDKIIPNFNAKTILYKNKFHNVYLSKDAENYLNETFGKIGSLKEGSPEAKKIYENIDYSLITKEDLSVMETASAFIDTCITKDSYIK